MSRTMVRSGRDAGRIQASSAPSGGKGREDLKPFGSHSTRKESPCHATATARPHPTTPPRRLTLTATRPAPAPQGSAAPGGLAANVSGTVMGHSIFGLCHGPSGESATRGEFVSSGKYHGATRASSHTCLIDVVQYSLLTLVREQNNEVNDVLMSP